MLGCGHGLARNQFSSSNPSYQRVHSKCDGSGDIEFDFWGGRKTGYYDTFDNLDGCEVEFQFQACVEESFGKCPLLLRGANMETDASLLPNNHFYGNLSPGTRKQAIKEGRKELVEMIRNMPESSYELSLKDIVDQQHAVAVKGKAVSEDKSIHLETESKAKKQQKKKRKAGPILRPGSMDADSFMLKMFVPTSLSFKKKSTAENSSKVSPSPACEGSKKPVDKQGWIQKIFFPANHKNREDSSNESRHANRSSLPGCWLFFLSKKSRAKKQGDFII